MPQAMPDAGLIPSQFDLWNSSGSCLLLTDILDIIYAVLELGDKAGKLQALALFVALGFWKALFTVELELY